VSRFAAIKTDRSPTTTRSEAAAPVTGKSPARTGKKAVSGYFSPEMSQALHTLALNQRTSLQALMGEAFDDLLRKYGKHPFGER
jgi:hypothetical protein